MKNSGLPRHPLVTSLSILTILWIFQGTTPGVFAQAPAGDLTVTVEELDGGEVRFSLAGSVPLREESSFNNTGYNNVIPSPPHTLTYFAFYLLPPGLKLSAGGDDFDITRIYFDPTSFWYMGSFGSSTFPQGTNVVGSGTGISNTIPFSNFIPGTYEVAGQAFDVTYRVIAKAAPAPRLGVTGPGRFPATLLRRSSRPRNLLISNTGNAAATGLKIDISGRASRDFKVTQPPGTLAAGTSTALKITFKPRAKGVRKADATITAANAASAGVVLLGKGK